ncbi:hypothetical protein CXU13_09965 [Akkermansia muciniphila]|nr:hypothetical protein CXU16_10595 [Akkermansia muciniphila]PNC41593.1 hypothetical protein CXU10_01885 [Akkermansia muciniphila]PNC41834.1 hypothetical protein CXU14_12795 [Akkermansia muciniphila]PNC58576.1 hypothetical protein CXU13_09965 [Akkermansia muciniphila]
MISFIQFGINIIFERNFKFCVVIKFLFIQFWEEIFRNFSLTLCLYLRFLYDSRFYFRFNF